MSQFTVESSLGTVSGNLFLRTVGRLKFFSQLVVLDKDNRGDISQIDKIISYCLKEHEISSYCRQEIISRISSLLTVTPFLFKYNIIYQGKRRKVVGDDYNSHSFPHKLWCRPVDCGNDIHP